ncbi:MAG: META domain-containing protein [Alphaproteobacteria bacterium]|nr:META domain-containing protein [Alphaproteobacteria bacterium]
MKKTLLALTIALSLSACASNPYDLDSSVYYYQLNNTPITISFDSDANRFSGKVVNNYFGTYEQHENSVTLHPLGATMMMGPENAMQAEQEWMQILLHVKNIQQIDNHLIFTLSNGTKIRLVK